MLRQPITRDGYGRIRNIEMLNLQQNVALVRVLFDRRITATPRRVFRTMREQGLAPEGGLRAKLSGGVLRRLAMLRFFTRWIDGEQLSRHDGRWVLNSFLPPFPGAAYDRMFENLLSGRRLSPVSAFLAVTSECPAQCWHCSLKKRPGGSLSTDAWLDMIRQVHGIGASLIGLTGGEPLTRDDLPQMIRAIQQGGAEAILFTSGIGLSAARAEELRDAGLWAVGVSLDRTDPEEVNRMRGTPAAWEAALGALEYCREAGLYTCINAVADRQSVESGHYRDLYRLARDLRLHELRLIEPMPCGRLLDTASDVFLEPRHVAELRRFHRRTNRRGRRPKVCAFNQIESPEIFGCGAGTRHLFIDAAGEVCPCDFTPLSFGNLTTEPLADIWRRMTDTMGGPRRHCFIQKNIELVRRHVSGGPIPAPLEISLRVMADAPPEELPDYAKLVMEENVVAMR